MSARGLGAFALPGLPGPEPLFQVAAAGLLADFRAPRIIVAQPPAPEEG